jgi:hypothetical protein
LINQLKDEVKDIKMPISREIYPFLDTIATKIFEYLARPEIN